MYETLMKEFRQMPAVDREAAEREILSLRASIGTVEIRDTESGAIIVVDGRERGRYPETGSFDIGAGAHIVRLSKDGFAPFENRIEIAGRQRIVLNAHLSPLAHVGRLRVTEQEDRNLELIVDGVVVGTTPWEGPLAVGAHNAVLRGEGAIGSQPVDAAVRENELTVLRVAAETLDAVLRVEPAPIGADVAIDGVSVGHGVWEGRVRAGGHRVEVAQVGFLAVQRIANVPATGRSVVVVTLDRDPGSALWGAAARPHVFLEIDAGFALSPSLGGDVIAACRDEGACSAGLAAGAFGRLHGGYRFASGLALGIDAGYVALFQGADPRTTRLTPVGRTPNVGATDDAFRISGFLFGASGSFRRGTTWPLTLRLGVGALLAATHDARSGTFTNSLGQTYGVDVAENESSVGLFVAPEARIGRRLNDRMIVDIGLTVLAMAALSTPSWHDEHLISTSPNPQTEQGDGGGVFGSQSLGGSTLVMLLLGVGLHYDL